MADTTNLSIRIDRGLKDEADRMFSALGMNLTTAITVFVKQAVMQRRIPFEITLPNDGKEASRQAAIEATERIWQNSIKNGTDNMTLDEINSEISAARRERRERRQSEASV
ncbi:MAG: type II toxin-antitoxin system RelB/DinJ family antitoxin [Oscillospiraceae bacterium]|nr:type II toxin-antitoxin system RelB/DinJ family antitoxin [Oscillospiraceae bacterium]